MSGSTIKAVVCDADGTLFQLKAPLATTYSEILNTFGYRLDVEVFNLNLRQVWQDFTPEYLNQEEQHKTSPECERAVWFTFIEKICSACGVTELSTDAKEAIYSYYAGSDSRSLCVELQKGLAQLADEGLLIFLATNNDSRIHQLVKELLPADFFDGVFTAGELGWKKPSPRFFKSIEDRIRLSANEILHVGNDITLDVQAAEEAGWRALHFSPGNFDEKLLREEISNLSK